MIGSWVKAATWMVEKNAIKLAAAGGASLLHLGQVQGNGKTGYGNAIDGQVASINKAHQMEEKLIRMGRYARPMEEVYEQEIERKMYALRAYILSFITVGDDGYYHLITHGDTVTPGVTDEELTQHINRYADTLDICIEKLFPGDRVPISGPCFKATGIKSRKGMKGETNLIPTWVKVLSATIVMDPATGQPDVWFTWNKNN